MTPQLSEKDRSYCNRVSVFIALYIGYYALLGFSGGSIDVKYNTYPFSGFRLYQWVQAKKPYDEHQSHEMIANRIIVNGARGAAVRSEVNGQTLQSYLNDTYKKDTYLKSTAQLNDRLRLIANDLKVRWGIEAFDSLDWTLVVLQTPPYPAAPKASVVRQASRGILHGDGRFVSAMVIPDRDKASKRPFVRVETEGYVDPEYRLWYHRSYIEEPKALPGKWEGDRFFHSLPEDAVYLFAISVKEKGSDAPAATYIGRWVTL